MNSNYVFFALFALALGGMLYRMVRYRGFRGGLYGAGVQSTVAEIELAPRGMVRSRLKVHALEGDPLRVGLEVIHTTIGSWQTVPVALSLTEARQLAEALVQAIGRADSSVAAG